MTTNRGHKIWQDVYQALLDSGLVANIKLFENAVHKQREKFIQVNVDVLGCDQNDAQ